MSRQNGKVSGARADEEATFPGVPGEFGGTIGRTYDESTPWYPPQPGPAKGAPNVVVILLDDVGFAQFGCFGSSIDTPNINRLAREGLRYNNFHVTPLCSPTRASLLTGRNNHAVGVGSVVDLSNGFPNRRGAITPRAATLAEMLQLHGYNTYALGKWHLAPYEQHTAIGPFDNWPLRRGFDRFYGFLVGADDQWFPTLYSDNHRVPTPQRPDYHLSDDLVDQATGMVRDHMSVDPDKPFFLYLAYGACHGPHQAPRRFIDKYRGHFDDGWDVERERIYERQLAQGAVPPNAQLAPPNPGVKAWADLTDDERAICARHQEVFAASLEHTDETIGRLLDTLESMGTLDNTLVMVLSDNGASFEGRALGSGSYLRSLLGVKESVEEKLAVLDDLGGPKTAPMYPGGWAMAGNTPLKWYKMHTFGGGVRSSLVMRLPGRLSEPGTFRSQFHYVTDIVPTVLEVAGIDAPTEYHGIPQLPLHGTSMCYSWQDPTAKTRHDLQYFEMAGHRGLWNDGWKAVTRHIQGASYDQEPWSLYHLDEDFSECDDQASAQPERLRQMVETWWEEAEKYDVLPLDDESRLGVEEPPGAFAWRTPRTFYPGMTTIPANTAPDISDRSFTIRAEIERPTGEEDGVLLACGGQHGGWSLFVKDHLLVFDYNAAGRHSVVTSDQPLTRGRHKVSVEAERIGDRRVRCTLRLGDTSVATGEIATLSYFHLGEGMECGADELTPVSTEYASPFRFAGTIEHVTVELGKKGKERITELNRMRWAEQ